MMFDYYPKRIGQVLLIGAPMTFQPMWQAGAPRLPVHSPRCFLAPWAALLPRLTSLVRPCEVALGARGWHGLLMGQRMSRTGRTGGEAAAGQVFQPSALRVPR